MDRTCTLCSYTSRSDFQWEKHLNSDLHYVNNRIFEKGIEEGKKELATLATQNKELIEVIERLIRSYVYHVPEADTLSVAVRNARKALAKVKQKGG